MNLPLEQLAKLLIRELKTYKTTVVILFCVISLGCLSIGLVWPQIYTSTTTILSDNQNIIQPLLEGAAVSAKVENRLKHAKEMIFSQKIIHQLLLDNALITNNTNPLEEELISENIKKKITVTKVGNSLIKIEFKGDEANKVFLITKSLANLFVAESVKTQASESLMAYNFIDDQVSQYHGKLVEAESNLKRLRTENYDARAGSQDEVNQRIARIRRNDDAAKLALREEKIKLKSLEEQISGEVEITVANTRKEQHRVRISKLISQLDILRLSYHDEHPDIIRINRQIGDIKQRIIEEAAQSKLAREDAKRRGTLYVDEGVGLSPLYDELRGQLLKSKTLVLTLNARIVDAKSSLEIEINRLKRINDTEAELADLTRDYEVNRDMYTNLLTRRERANISMNLGKASTGPSFNIQEPARLPLVPTGLRFLHFLIAGMVLGVMIPIGLLVALINFDPRVRSANLIEEKLNIPVLATIPHIKNPQEALADKSTFRNLIIVVFLVILVNAAFGVSKFIGVLP